MTTCFFIGHRDAKDDLLPELVIEVERHIKNYGVTEFVVGRYGRFDGLAARAVKLAKKKYPDVRLIYLRPYHPAERPEDTSKGFDGSFYPPGMESVPRKLAIVRANRYMVEHSDFLIAYTWHPASNSREVVEYAMKRERRGLIRVTMLSTNQMTDVDKNIHKI